MAVLIAMFLSFGPGATAVAYPPSDAVLSVSERTLPPSTPFEATVSGCTPGESVTFNLVDNDPVTVTCGADGIATTTLISPTTPGRYDVTAVLANGTVLTVTITVISAVTTTVPPTATTVVTGPGTIPSTGTDATSTTLLFGGGLVIFGAAFLLVARLRRRDDSTALA